MHVLTTEDQLELLGGIEVGTLATSKDIVRNGHRVTLLYRQTGSSLGQWSVSGAAVQHVPHGFTARPRTPLRSTAGLVRSIKTAVQCRPDVIWVHRWYEGVFAGVSARLSGGRSVMHLHQIVPAKLSWPTSFGLATIDRFVAVSEHTRRAWVDRGVDADLIDVVHNGVDLRRFAPIGADAIDDARREWGIPPGAILVAYAGRLDRSKGVSVLLEAIARLGEGVHLVIAGDATFDADEVAVGARSTGVPRVTWLGRVSDVERVYAAADVVAVPSLGSEPFGRTAAEAMACGAPVVASAVGGLPEIVGGVASNRLIPPGDVDALATALRAVGELRRKDEAQRIAWVKEHFDGARSAAAMEEVFKLSLKRPHPSLQRVLERTFRLRARLSQMQKSAQGARTSHSDG